MSRIRGAKPLVGCSAVLMAIMMATAAVAQPTRFDYSFEDPEGDVEFASWAGGSKFQEGTTLKQTELANIGIVDIKRGWVIDDGVEVTFGMEMWDVWTEETTLPEGVEVIWWIWCLYRQTGGAENFFANYLIIIQWDGTDWKAYFSSGEEEELLWYVELGEDDYAEFDNGGSTITANVPVGDLWDVNYWFSEVRVQFRDPPEVPYEWQNGGWFAVDVTDWDSSISYLPWLPVNDWD